MRTRIYVGWRKKTRKPERFRSAVTPTESTHGNLYLYVMGPFRTVAGADFQVKYGAGNPHTTTVYACEKLAAQEKARAA